MFVIAEDGFITHLSPTWWSQLRIDDDKVIVRSHDRDDSETVTLVLADLGKERNAALFEDLEAALLQRHAYFSVLEWLESWDRAANE